MEQITGFVKTLGVSGLIMILMGIFYKVAEKKAWLMSDSVKTCIVVALGGVVGIFYLFYSMAPCTLQGVSDHFFYGVKEGLTAIGMFKVGQAIGIYSPPKQEIKQEVKT